MYQGTTPAIVYTIKNVDLSAMTAYVSFQCGKDILTKKGDEVSVSYSPEDEMTMVVCSLTQEETLKMLNGVETQIRFIDSDGQAYSTEKAKLRVKDVIYKQVIDYIGPEPGPEPEPEPEPEEEGDGE